MKFCVYVFFGLLALGGASSISPVQKVIQLIDDMAGKVKKDLDESNLVFEDFAKYCDDEASNKEFAAKNSKEQIEALDATITDAEAKISNLEAKVDDLTTKIASSEVDLAKATSLRAEEHAEFGATEKFILGAITELGGATETLQRGLAMVQLTPDARKGLDTVVASLGQIVDASFVTHEQRSKVQAFLQAQEDAQDSLTIKQPEEGEAGVIGLLGDLTDRAEETLSDTRKGEAEAAHAFVQLKTGIENQIKSQREEMSEATKMKQFNAEGKAGAGKDLAVEEKGLAEDTQYVADLKRDCQQRAARFEAESRDGNSELTALGKAKTILTKKFGALLQTMTVAEAKSGGSEDARAKALRHVEKLGRKFHSTMLVALAYRASADPFIKVRSMIESMMQKLLQEAAEEATQKAFCDEEIGKSKKSQADKEESLAKTQARIDKADAATAKLSELVATLSQEVAEIDASVADATAVREKEKADFVKAEKDMSESEEACAAAISVLREYYEGASLVQLKAGSKSRAKGDSSGILGVLEIAESDFAKLLAEARSAEEAAIIAYNTMTQENKMLKATKEVDVKGKQSELKSLKTSTADYNEDKEGVSGELNAVLDYLDKLKPQCETKGPSYAERKAEREAEIQGLKEALDILAADGVPTFLQIQTQRDPMETIGNTAGSVGSGVGDVTGPVTGPVGDVAGGAATTVGDGAGSAGSSVAGENPMEKVPLVGGAFKVSPVSTALNCVVSLTIQYFVVYTALAICRTAADVWNLKYEAVPLQKILQTAAITVNYAPMLAVLFLAVRMRVTWLTQGKGNPPVWMQAWMYCATYAVLLMTLIVVVIPLFTGEMIGVDQKTGDLKEDKKPFDNFILATCFTVLKYFIMIGLYVGVICIIYGTVTFQPPQGTWPGNKVPPVAPAVACTMIMACMYFVVYACVQFSRTWTQFTGSKYTKFEQSMMNAANAMNFAPMLSVLFIGARMRALQMDPVNGAPQKWAQNCFYMCTYAVAAQVLISIAVTLVLSGTSEPNKNGVEGDMVFTVANPVLGSILSVGRYIIMFCIYVGFSCVIYSIFTIQHPNGPQYTPPISVTMQCVINLTFQFFFIYLMIWICVTIDEFTGMKWALLINTMENMKGTVAFCPMLAILFVGTRMRALLITNNKGAPQGWVQDGMYMATWAILIQFLFGLIVPLCTGTATPCDEDGTPEYKPAHPIALYCVLALKWFTYIFLYGGVIAVITGVYTMTPETANGRGSVPLVGDYVGEPVGVNDIPNPTF